MRRLAFLLPLVVVVACGSPLTSGEVTGRSYVPAHTTTYPIFFTICTGKPLVCHQQYAGQGTIHHDPCWRVDFRDGDRKGHACTTHRRWLETVNGSGWSE